MAAFGNDFRRARAGYLYDTQSPWKIWQAVLIALLLLGVSVVLQSIFGMAFLFGAFDGDFKNYSEVIKATIAGIFPAAVVAAWFFIWVARWRNGLARDRLALHFPDMGWLGWTAIIVGFLVCMYASIGLLTFGFGIDTAKYMPSIDGSTPGGNSAGTVESAVFQMAKEPLWFWLSFLSLAIGAPLGEELIFRGQLFATLRQSVVGPWGAVVISSLAWAALHFNPDAVEPIFPLAVIFGLGLALGWLLLRTGSLWVTLICHGVWNGMYALLALAGVNA
jgi:uncharacterized protein